MVNFLLLLLYTIGKLLTFLRFDTQFACLLQEQIEQFFVTFVYVLWWNLSWQTDSIAASLPLDGVSVLEKRENDFSRKFLKWTYIFV